MSEHDQSASDQGEPPTIKSLRREVRGLWGNVILLLSLIFVVFLNSPSGARWIAGGSGETRWVGQALGFYNKDWTEGGYCFCQIGVVEHDGGRFARHGTRVGAEQILLTTELGERVVELFRDPVTGEGRILLYGRNGDVIWQAPEPCSAVGSEETDNIPHGKPLPDGEALGER